MNLDLKFSSAVILLAIAAIFLQARGRNEVIPIRQPLSSLPQHLGGWTGEDVSIPADQLEVLGPGDFLLRVYSAPQALADVDLFIAYFPSQRMGDTIHSPKNCLPGAGWSPLESTRISVSLPGQTPFLANRYVIGKGNDRQLVLYWYLAHDRAVASEYWAKFYLIADSMRLNRSDGSLIRITTPLSMQENSDTAEQRLLSFAGQVVPLLDRYIPR